MDAIAAIMNSLDMVLWDRCICRTDAGLEWVMAYGWIDRYEDTYKDFVVILFEGGRPYYFTTSSAKYSPKISKRLFPGNDPSTHRDCERIGDVFGDKVTNKTETK